METPTPSGVLRLEADQPARLVVLRALQLGDLLCAVPAMRALRSALPAAHIALVGLPWARDFVDRFGSYLDEFIEFPGYPGLPERAVDVRAVPPFLASIQQRGFDLAIQMQGDGRITNGLVALFGARRMAGFYEPGQPEAAGDVMVAYPSWLPEVRRHLHLVASLGARVESEHLEFPVREAEEREWAKLCDEAALRDAPYACLHAGARDRARCWPPSAFAQVAQALAGRGLNVVLTGHGPGERERAAAVAAACDAPLVDMTGRTSLGALGAAVRGARLLVSNDTGVSHVAAAMRTPSVIVFLTTDPRRWAPLDGGRHRVVRDGAGAVQAVIAESERLLAGEGVRAA